MNRWAVIVLVLALTGCSTVDRRGYYEPSVDSMLRTGPEKPFCGWTNFGGAPDRYVSTTMNHSFSVTANQYIHPYLWGPWFASVLPVFPITWLAELFVDDRLEIEIEAAPESFVARRREEFFISDLSSNKGRVYPSSIRVDGSITRLVFPVDADEVEKFIFHIKGYALVMDSMVA